MSRLIPLGALSSWKKGETKTLSLYPGAKGIAIRKGDQIFAYRNTCTHMGGPLQSCGDDRFRCEWHFAEFNALTGEALVGQAPPGSFLAKVETVLKDDGIVYAKVDLPIDPFA